MTESIEKHCPQCDEKMDEIFNASNNFAFVGWYCPKCKLFDSMNETHPVPVETQ